MSLILSGIASLNGFLPYGVSSALRASGSARLSSSVDDL
jgi:hypothetical protein